MYLVIWMGFFSDKLNYTIFLNVSGKFSHCRIKDTLKPSLISRKVQCHKAEYDQIWCIAVDKTKKVYKVVLLLLILWMNLSDNTHLLLPECTISTFSALVGSLSEQTCCGLKQTHTHTQSHTSFWSDLIWSELFIYRRRAKRLLFNSWD